MGDLIQLLPGVVHASAEEGEAGQSVDPLDGLGVYAVMEMQEVGDHALVSTSQDRDCASVSASQEGQGTVTFIS
jgi:hypothetical protein